MFRFKTTKPSSSRKLFVCTMMACKACRSALNYFGLSSSFSNYLGARVPQSETQTLSPYSNSWWPKWTCLQAVPTSNDPVPSNTNWYHFMIHYPATHCFEPTGSFLFRWLMWWVMHSILVYWPCFQRFFDCITTTGIDCKWPVPCSCSQPLF